MSVIISGASSGIGRSLAELLSARGARLTLAARRQEKLRQLNEQLGGRHLVVVADVANPEDCRRVVEEARQRFGRIDTLVANAGYGLGRPVVETTPDDWRDILATNVLGTTELIRHAVPIMRAQAARGGYRGQVMVVSSAAARRGLVYFGAYSATKAAQLSVAEALRVELEPDGIAVTSVHPVTTSTEFFRVAEQRTGRRLQVPGRTPLSQQPAQVARAMARRIASPSRECWPHEPSRWLLGLAALFPSAGDLVMRRVKRVMDGAS